MSSGRKKEYEEVLNKIFGTSIRWSKLSLEELTQLATVLANPGSLCERLCSKEARYVDLLKLLRDTLREIPYEGPLVKLLKKFMKVEEGGKEEKDTGGGREA